MLNFKVVCTICKHLMQLWLKRSNMGLSVNGHNYSTITTDHTFLLNDCSIFTGDLYLCLVLKSYCFSHRLTCEFIYVFTISLVWEYICSVSWRSDVIWGVGEACKDDFMRTRTSTLHVQITQLFTLPVLFRAHFQPQIKLESWLKFVSG